MAVYVTGAACIDVMDIDSSHYAEMSREIYESGQYLEIKNRFVDDYLDKPPLIFWLVSVFYHLFGVSAFVFRIPAILASVLGAYSVYRFTRLYYDRETGLLAGLMLLTSQVYFLYNHNVLTDTFLANFTIFSIWQLAAFLHNKRWIYLLGAIAGISLAMMSKGPLGIMVPVIGFAGHFVYKREWKNVFRWEWPVALVVVLLLLAPMMAGLYRQFGEIGLQFFFWTQSFGRLTGQSHWHNQSSPFFFVHTFLWFFLPWTFLGIYGLVKNLRPVFFKQAERQAPPELITSSGFVLSFLILSSSGYKLPQYIFVLIPLMAVLAASGAMNLIRQAGQGMIGKWITGGNYFLAFIYGLGIVLILVIAFPGAGIIPWFFLATGVIAFFFLHYTKHLAAFRLVLPVAAMAIFANLVLGIYFYPGLLHYQTGRRVAAEIQRMGIQTEMDLYLFRYHSPALDFHLGYPPPIINLNKLERLAGMRDTCWIVTDHNGRNLVDEVLIDEEIRFDQYPAQAITFPFLNPEKRPEVLRATYLIKISKKIQGN